MTDTSAIVAMLDPADLNHTRAAEAWRGLAGGAATLLATSYTVLETHAVLQRRFGMAGVRRFEADVVPRLEVLWIDQDIHGEGVARLLAADTRALSLVDCVSFATMWRLGGRWAFTFDPHFAEQGFEVIPEALPSA